jgi:hypothetical protein
MPTRLTSVVIDSADPSALARWWASALGWRLDYDEADESFIGPPPGEPGIRLTFVPVTDPKLVQNRVHLDLRSPSLAGQQELTGRLLDAGASEADIGQGEVPWSVLADPEGNEFCVVDPRPEYADTGALAAVLVAALNPAALARFWAAASGRRLRPDAVEKDSYDLLPPDGRGPWLEFIGTDKPHTVKNRVHLDVAPFADDDQASEVARLLALGAFRTEVGQSQAPEGWVTWVVLIDPEDNEFCMLSSRK